MSIFSGKDGQFILENGTDSLRVAYVEGKISKRKAYAIAKGAPNNENIQNVALIKSGDMSAEELEIFVKILLAKATKVLP